MFFKPHSFAVLAFLAGILGTINHAQADDTMPPRLPEVGPLQYQGNGCPQGTVQGGLADNGNYEMIFDAFEAVTSPAIVQASANCNFRVNARLAPGWKLQIGAVFIDGTQKIAEQGSGRVDTSYRVGNSRGFKWGTDLASTNGEMQNLNIQAMPNDGGGPADLAQNWSSCGGSVVVSGDLHVLAHRGAGLQDASEVILHNRVSGGVPGGGPGGVPVGGPGGEPAQNALRWDWQYAPCLAGHWNSQYVTADGQQIDAVIIANGTEGEYHVASGGRTFVGKLSSLHSEGNAIVGRWSLGNSQGWLSFAPNAEGHFDGSWGLGEEGSPALGSWNGDSADH